MNSHLILAYASAALAAVLALGSALRARHSISRWAFVAGMVTLAAERMCNGLRLRAPWPDEMLYWRQWGLIATSWLPASWLLFSLSYARGNAREFVRRWRVVLGVAFLFPVVLALWFSSHLIAAVQQIEPDHQFLFRLGWAGIALYVFLLIASVLVLTNLERTYRASVGTMRWRIKFMLLGAGLLFVVRLYTSSQALLFRGMNPPLEILNSGALILAIGLMLRSLFRAGHFDLDVYPSQSVLQGSLTVLLAGVYLLIVGAFAKIVAYLGGDAAFAFKAFGVLVSVVLLAVLLQSDRVRLRVRQFINRNFQRPLYDYRTIWGQFTEATATRIDLGDLCRSLVKLVADLSQALSVTIWLVDENRGMLTLAASTSLSDVQAGELRPQGADAAEIIRHLKQYPEPVDIETIKENWAAALRQCHPDQFHKGGTRVCVPIVGGGGLLAVITIGDRVAGTAFSLQDLDVLKCVGDQAAASVLNMRLSQTLLQARELEAFQTMAAFFVHDLKNAASTLNLMLQNLPVHFDDPAFREDALRGIAKTVAHINDLIGRLSLLRHELKIQPAIADLNAVVTGALASLRLPGGIELAQDLKALPSLRLDQEQVVKVVTNLVLNAADAVGGAGQVRVTTDQLNSWVVLTVADNGCGMSAEFVNRSLFRPFQTTKKSGLGIGMFQSKMIVEAHGGRIEVASEPGRGTTMQVFLPLVPPGAGVGGKD